MDADFVVAEQSAGDVIKPVDAGLFEIPEIAVEDRTAGQRRSAEGEKRLITAEGQLEIGHPREEDEKKNQSAAKLRRERRSGA